MNDVTLKSLAKQGKVEIVKQDPLPPPPPPVTPEEIQATVQAFGEFLPLIQKLRLVKRPLLAAPTNTPKNLLEMFEVMDDGAGTVRLYFYVGTTWRYVALT